MAGGLLTAIGLSVVSLAPVAAVDTVTATPPPGMYVNPVLPRDFPDPDVLQVGQTYYAYATNSEGINIQAARSTDLVHWDLLPDALPQLPAWAAQEFGWTWAPDVSEVGGQYVMYHVARYQGIQCIGVAISAEPQGPFAPVEDVPLICQAEQGGSIDPASFTDHDGQRYVLWKNDGNAIGNDTWVYIQPTTADGLGLTGAPTPLLTSSFPWEGLLIEGPTLWRRDGVYYLFYSANSYAGGNYAVGYATSEALLGPYTKPSEKPWLKTSMTEGVLGPGGQDVVQTADGRTWLLYHAWLPNGRDLFLTEVTWEGTRPLITVERDPQPVPNP